MGGYEENKLLISEKFLSIHYKFLNSQSIDLLDQIIWLLTNIICENVEFRNIIFKTPIIEKIRNITYNSLNFNQANLLKSTSNFLYYSLNYSSLSKELNESLSKILPIIIRLIMNSKGEIFTNSLWALVHISNAEDKEYIKDLFNKFIFQNNGELFIKILSLDFESSKMELILVIRIFANLLSLEDEEFLNNLLELNILAFFDKTLISEKNKKIKHEILLAISNLIKDSNISQIKQLLESNLYNSILGIANDYDIKLKKDAIILIFTICNLSNFNLSTELVKRGTFRMVIELLENTSDHQIILYCLYSIDRIIATGEFLKSVLKDNTIAKKFEACGGCDCLEKFQSNLNMDIYAKAMEILEKYFETYSEHMLLCKEESKHKNNFSYTNNYNDRDSGINDKKYWYL